MITRIETLRNEQRRARTTFISNCSLAVVVDLFLSAFVPLLLYAATILDRFQVRKKMTRYIELTDFDFPRTFKFWTEEVKGLKTITKLRKNLKKNGTNMEHKNIPKAITLPSLGFVVVGWKKYVPIYVVFTMPAK